jgi:RHS repeat-associated protein
MRAAALCPSSRYPYGGMAYADPDAVTQIANGLSTTCFQYDNDGNVVQKTTDGTTTTYIYDYLNHLTALGSAGATTTYAYDAFGARILQTGTSTTTFYPFKWYSVASSTGSGAKYATTTSYVFNGDTLLSTVDQQTASGVATGTAKSRYVHPDHLGSTNVVTDENDNVVQTLDYYPYGSTRISAGTSTNERRKFIGQFPDDSTLTYDNARYYNPNQGQFLSEDPTFLAVGNPSQLQKVSKQDQQKLLSDLRQINSYSYGRDNPTTNKDSNGNAPVGAVGPAPLIGLEAISGPVGWAALGVTVIAGGAYLYHSLGDPNWQTSVQVSGQGYDTDPKLPPKPPKGPWVKIAFSTVVAATGIYAFDTYIQPLLQPDNGLQPLSLGGSGGNFGLLSSPQATNNWSYSAGQ